MGYIHQNVVSLIMLIFEWLITSDILLYFVGICLVITAFDILKKLLNL